MDPRTPVIVGSGQFTVTDRSVPTSTKAILVEAAQRALADTGAGERLRAKTQSVGVVNTVTWWVGDHAAEIAAELGITPTETVGSHIGGTAPLEHLRDACARIAQGELSVAVITGGEAVKAMNDGRYVADAPVEGPAPTRVLGTDRVAVHELELATGLGLPTQIYPLFEHALRAADGQSRADLDAEIGALWARLAEVAKSNPHAWDTSAPDADTILSSRMIADPYRKLLTANIQVDQGAALVVCSAEAAEAAGVPKERWVFPHAVALGNDHWFVSSRDELHRSPAIAGIGSALRDHTGLGTGEIAHLDLYSCFPSAVRIAARELGVDLTDRVPSVTGGLTFSGGPANNYVTHSVATMVDRLREDPAATGLCTAVGWFLTKHGGAVLSGRPPAREFGALSVDVSGLPSREIVSGGSGTVETFTVEHDRYGQRTGFVLYRTESGARGVGQVSDVDSLDCDPIGHQVTTVDGTLQFS
ncbi:acetyl-CoA acetyltransferase [Pseudonocardiaceae bacterium YIM PH 21723]|nr:acetyl-CoA acetyltransferase [Pseudonocardiaceae bacterium YIM PH 21723]